MKQLKLELSQLGLREKEASVYITLLTLGASTVQIIARKSNIPRASTYLILDTLIERGLVTRYLQNKKNMFMAQSPLTIASLIKQEEEKVAMKRNLVDEILPKLFAITRNGAKQPVIRYYEGLEGLKAVRHELGTYTPSLSTWYVVMPLDSLREVFGKDFLYVVPRTSRKIRAKTIFTTRSSELKKFMLATSKQQLAERKFISPEKYSDNVGIVIFYDRVTLVVFGKTPGAIVVESKEAASFAASFFNLLWEQLPEE